MTLRYAVDRTTTANLRAAKLILDKRSFIGKDGHLYFFGEDKARLRPIIFRLHKSKCCVCGHHLAENEDSEPWSNDLGEWHHPGKCDCPTKDCSEIRCSPTTGRKCHSHREPGFQRVAPRVQSNSQENP